MSDSQRTWTGGPVYEGPEDEEGGSGSNPPPPKPNPGDDRGVDPEELKRQTEQEE